MNSWSQSNNLGLADWLVSSAKRNPEGLLLLAAGAALLARTARPATARGSARRTEHDYSGYQDAGESFMENARSSPRTAQGADTMGAARPSAANIGGAVSDMGSRVSDAASSYAASVSQFANESTRIVGQRSGELYDKGASALQSTVQRIVREQPLMVALAGLAAGATVAAAFPRTNIEERALGPAGERISEFASQKAEQLKNAGMAATQHVMSSAEQRGLSPEALKDVARGAADVFGRAMSEQGEASRSSAGGGSTDKAPPRSQGNTDQIERLE